MEDFGVILIHDGVLMDLNLVLMDWDLMVDKSILLMLKNKGFTVRITCVLFSKFKVNRSPSNSNIVSVELKSAVTTYSFSNRS